MANYGLVNPAQESAGAGSRSGVTGGVLFGGTATLAGEEGKLGRKLALVRVYYRLGETFPTPFDRRLMAAGSTLLVSLDTKPGQATYADIAAGQQDAAILAFLKAVNRAAVQYHLASIYFCFEHEANAPQHHTGLGSPGEFIAAWDHIRRLAAAAHLDWNQGGRIHWVWILTHEGFVPLASRPRWARIMDSPTAYWPGPNEVDIIAADGYDSHGCRLTRGLGGSSGPEATPTSLFGPVVAFAHANGGLPVFVAEWGGATTAGQVQFIHRMQSFASRNREIAAVSYWNSNGPRCHYSVSNSPASVAALAAMGHTPAMQGRLSSSG